jgi:hypothetical protein
MRVLERVGHAADAVVLLDEQVLGHDLLARRVLLRRVEVLDDLEHVRVRRQVEHQHHHALDARRDAEAVAAVPQVVHEVAVEHVLALLLQAERAVQLGAGLARHHAAQELHVGARHLHVDHEVGARVTEDHQQLVLAEERRVDDELAAGAFAGMQDRQRQRDLDEAVDDLADEVGALVAEEQARQHLDLKVRARAERPQFGQHRLRHVGRVAVEVLELQRELEVVDDALPGLAQVLARRVVGPVGGLAGRLVVLDVLGADGRAHEDEVVVEVAAVKQLGRHRVEEGLGKLGLVMVGQQADVVQLDLLPGVHAELVDAELGAQAQHRFVDAHVVELDALALRALLAVPVGTLEALLGRGAGLAEEAVVPVEAVAQRGGDVVGARVVEALREHGRQPGKDTAGSVGSEGGLTAYVVVHVIA